jgi:hypothetical protein
MVKTRYFSTKNDFKTGFLYKIFLMVGIILLIFYILQHTFNLVNNMENIAGIALAFSILFIGGGILLGFFSYLFSKLAKITDEIEKEMEDEESD